MATEPTVRARSLRNAMSEPEVFLWAQLKRLHAQGYHFRRQRPCKGYYLDFVCIDRMLVVEIDGCHHGEPLQAEHDRIRDAVLGRAGYRVLRFSNKEVRHEVDRVMDIIIQTLEARPSRFGRGVPAADGGA